MTVLKPQKISRDDFIAAFHATAAKRGTEKRVPVFSRILNSIQVAYSNTLRTIKKCKKQTILL